MNNSDPNHLVKHDEYNSITESMGMFWATMVSLFQPSVARDSLIQKKKIRKIPVYTKMEVKDHPYTNVHVYYW